MKDMNKFIGGIVLYNPNLQRLKENISAIINQVDKLILIENGSKDLKYLDQLDSENLIIVKNNVNKGIAYALNQIMQLSYNWGYKWVLTLDQDSVVSSNLIETYQQLLSPEIGIIHCNVIDRNFARKCLPINKDEPIKIKECITSGSLTNVEAWKKIGGFDENLFIDCVDWDFCNNLRDHNYGIIKTHKTYIIHELGQNTKVKYIGKHELLITNHNKERNYFIFRNNIYLARKYKDRSLTKHVLRCIKLSVLSLFFSPNKLQVLKYQSKGFIDGFKMKINK